MTSPEALVRTEVEATIDRAGFESVSPEMIHVEVTDSFRRRLGECRPCPGIGSTAEYEIRIASRLFGADGDDQWRDTVRHEVAHAHVLETIGPEAQPHGDAWKDAAQRAGADPTARYEGDDDVVDAEYILACPNGCFERGYVQRAKRIKNPWLYSCDDCETQPISYDVTERPSDPEPGTCYVESIPWRTEGDRDEGGDGDSRYLLACPNGCTSWSYQQRSKRIKQPWRYSCPECGTKLLSCDGDDDPTDLDPGRCHVASIPWQEPQIVYACPNGCFSVGFGQHTEETRHPERYSCGDCGAQTVAYTADDRSATLESGTNCTDGHKS